MVFILRYDPTDGSRIKSRELPTIQHHLSLSGDDFSLRERLGNTIKTFSGNSKHTRGGSTRALVAQELPSLVEHTRSPADILRLCMAPGSDPAHREHALYKLTLIEERDESKRKAVDVDVTLAE